MRQELSAATSTSDPVLRTLRALSAPIAIDVSGFFTPTVTMFWAPQEIIDGIEIEAELAQVLGLNAADLEFEDHVAR